MTPELTQYLERIKNISRLNPPEVKGVLSELEAHFEDRFQELTASGLNKEDAMKACLGQMGTTELVARRIYEAYSQGSWTQVFLAAMPHVLFGLVFLLNWWHYVGWLTVVLVSILIATAYGWWHGKPDWVFSWLGYTLVPILILGILLLFLPNAWSLFTFVVYFPLVLFWLIRLIIKTSQKDWLFSSLTLLPLPVSIGWFLAVSPAGQFNEASVQRLDGFAPWIGVSLIVLAITIAVFLRLRQRFLRIGLLAVSGLLTLSLVVYYMVGRLNTLTFPGLILTMWGVLLVPPILERYLRYDEQTASKRRDSSSKKYDDYLEDGAVEVNQRKR